MEQEALEAARVRNNEEEGVEVAPEMPEEPLPGMTDEWLLRGEASPHPEATKALRDHLKLIRTAPKI